jgi:hypothetical protein
MLTIRTSKFNITIKKPSSRFFFGFIIQKVGLSEPGTDPTENQAIRKRRETTVSLLLSVCSSW